MPFGTGTSALDIISQAVEDCEDDMSESRQKGSSFREAPSSPAAGIKETIKNMTSSSFSYSSNMDASRGHLRLKMSGSRTPTMKMPSLLQKLPCLGNSNKNSPSSTSGASEASALAISALDVVEKGPYFVGERDDEPRSIEKTSQTKESNPAHSSESEKGEQVECTDASHVANHMAQVDLDAIDLDNITTKDLHGLLAADGDILRAKHLNKLSRKEREHVLQDIHGVADVMEEETNRLFVEESLKKLQLEINHELVLRKAKKGQDTKNIKQGPQQKKQDDDGSESDSSSPELPALEEQLGKLQQRLDQLVRRRKNFDNNMNEKQLSAKNHPMYGKMGDIGGFGSLPVGCSSSSNNRSKTSSRPTSVPSSGQGLSSSFFSPTTAMATSATTAASITNEAQRDAAILKSKEAFAYEQALAQCRGRRRERNNSLFRPNDEAEEEDDDLDEGRYIDVEQRDFRLSFLRAERYDIKNAARRLLDYFEEKRRLFGINYLTTKIQMKDLDPETKDCLESGQIQLLPERDRAGRAVIVGTKKLAINSDRRQDENSILRAFWILSTIALEDEQTETKGIVFVYYTIGGVDSLQRRGIDGYRRRVRQWGKVLNAMPLRVASIHWCVENFALKQAANLSALMLGGSNFVRVRCHAGSDMEVQYDLMTFGIPTDLFPVSMTGKVDVLRHCEFLRKRKKTEASALLNKALALVVDPPMLDDCNFDVNVDEQDPDTAIVPPSSVTTGGDPFTASNLVSAENTSHQSQSNSSRINLQNQKQYQQQQFDNHRSSTEYGLSNSTSTANNMHSASFNDSFCFIGNRNPMQAQSSMQHQYQQQQRLSSFQQQQLGMNMNMNMGMSMGMGMGMVQQYQQQQQHRNTSSKSGIPFSTEPVLIPGELDILLGRGRGAQNHKGNVHYRHVVETFRARYEQIPQKGAKTQLIREVVAVIYDNGGRFLKQDGFGRWIPVDPEVARDKVSHSFRNQKRLSVGGSSSGESKKRSRNDKGSN